MWAVFLRNFKKILKGAIKQNKLNVNNNLKMKFYKTKADMLPHLEYKII